ncbi:Transcription factor NAI1 [Camellia lanceoleosa]|uniref:Transcription factor NAI1 n=1 Tax=Camellia lanceoleosa TaxID=1840588 RepID=A0ACC0IW82_9ERIC|nr:Transcription factor NAI1 [Camellia lanceoleosa]
MLSGENLDGNSSKEAFPVIKARVSDMDVLIRIHFKQHNGLMVKILHEMEKLHLTIINDVALSVANTTLLGITIIAEMNVEFGTTAKELMKILQSAILSTEFDVQ